MPHRYRNPRRIHAQEFPRSDLGLRVVVIQTLPSGMMNVQDLDGISGDAIEDQLWIAPERHHANVRPAGGPSRALRPTRDVGHDALNAPPDGRRDRRVVRGQPIGDGIEITQCFVGIDDLH
nr:hypothetical protein [Rhodopseudomonas sp.]